MDGLIQVEQEFLRKEACLIKVCPRCSSPFVDLSQCDACGFQLIKNYLGEPLDHSSFYDMKEFYRHSLPAFVQLFPILELRTSNTALNYKKELSKRMRALLYQLSFDENLSVASKKIFYIELKDLIKELFDYEEDVKRLWRIVDEYEQAPFYRNVVSWMATCQKNRKKLSMVDFLNHRILGTLKMSTLLSFTFAIVCVTWASLHMFERLFR